MLCASEPEKPFVVNQTLVNVCQICAKEKKKINRQETRVGFQMATPKDMNRFSEVQIGKNNLHVLIKHVSGGWIFFCLVRSSVDV